MSCPEKGSLHGDPPYDKKVMEKALELQRRGVLKMGFDREGSSNACPEDKPLFDSKDDEQIKQTVWFATYKAATKAQVRLECQDFTGVLEVICIDGGQVTRIESEEMARILVDAEADARLSGVVCRTTLTKLSYYEFLSRFDPRSVDRQRQHQHRSGALPQCSSLACSSLLLWLLYCWVLLRSLCSWVLL